MSAKLEDNKLLVGKTVPVPDLPTGLPSWNLGWLRCIILLTLSLDFHTYAVIVHCTHSLSNPSVIFFAQLHSISEYCRKATNTNFIICGFTRPATECTIQRNRVEHAYRILNYVVSWTKCSIFCSDIIKVI